MSAPVIRRPGTDFHLAMDTVSESGRRHVGGQGGVPSAGDVLMLPGTGGRTERWRIAAVAFPCREHHPHMWDTWSAVVVPAPVALRVVA